MLYCYSRVIAAGAVLLLSAGLPPAIAQDNPPDATDKILAELSVLPRAERIERLREGAAKEGGIVIYGATGLDRGQFWVGEFNKLYPDLKVEFVRLTETDLVQKVTAEQKSSRIQSDVIIETSTYLPLISPSLSAYVPTSNDDLDARFKYGSPSEGWTAYAYEVFPEAIAWRSDHLTKDTAPASLEAIASSGFSGSIGTTANIGRLGTALAESYGEDKALKLLEALAATKSKVYSSHAALADGLASGEVHLAWNIIAARPVDLKAKGAPVEWTLMDPLYAESNTIAITKGTDSPYTAALFVEAILSPEVLEASDKWQAGRIFGNIKGSFQMSLDQYPNLKLFPVVDTATMSKWQTLGERMFLRRN